MGATLATCIWHVSEVPWAVELSLAMMMAIFVPDTDVVNGR